MMNKDKLFKRNFAEKLFFIILVFSFVFSPFQNVFDFKKTNKTEAVVSYKVPHISIISGSVGNGDFIMFGNGFMEPLSTEAEAQFRITKAGTVRNLRIQVGSANGSNSTTVRLRK